MHAPPSPLLRVTARLLDATWWLAWLVVAVLAVLVARGVVTGHQALRFAIPVQEPATPLLPFDVGATPDPEVARFSFLEERSVALGDGRVRVDDRPSPVRAEAVGPLEGELTLRFGRGLHPLEAALIVQAGLLLGIGLFIVLQLRRLVHAAAAGRPFGNRAGARIRAIGLAIVAAALLGPLSGQLVSHFAPGFEAAGVRWMPQFGLTFDVGALLMGLVVLCLAEVFRHGRDLAERDALTI